MRRILEEELAAADAAYQNSGFREEQWVRRRGRFHAYQGGPPAKTWIKRGVAKKLGGKAWDHTHPRKGFLKGAPRPGKYTPYKRIDSAEAARIEAATGIDVKGKFHVLDDAHVRHIHIKHGDEKAEQRRGQHAVRREHFERLHELHSSPTSVTTFEGINAKSKLPRIKTVGRVGRKRFELVEEVHDDYLVAVTLHLHNKVGAVADTAPAREAPAGTPETSAPPNVTTLRARCKLVLSLLQRRAA